MQHTGYTAGSSSATADLDSEYEVADVAAPQWALVASGRVLIREGRTIGAAGPRRDNDDVVVLFQLLWSGNAE